MIEIVLGVVALVGAIVFFSRRHAFVKARMTDRRTFFKGVWVRGLRPLSERDAKIAAWGGVALFLLAGVVFVAVGIRDLKG